MWQGKCSLAEPSRWLYRKLVEEGAQHQKCGPLRGFFLNGPHFVPICLKSFTFVVLNAFQWLSSLDSYSIGSTILYNLLLGTFKKTLGQDQGRALPPKVACHQGRRQSPPPGYRCLPTSFLLHLFLGGPVRQGPAHHVSRCSTFLHLVELVAARGEI